MAKREIVVNGSSLELSYELHNVGKDNFILFLHGWGSNKEIMKQAFAKTFDSYTHIYLDMPGFGNSSIVKPMDTDEYAMAVKLFLDALDIKPYMIFGHSFGGKVATLLSPEVLVLLSSAGIVTEKSFKVRAKIALFKAMKPFFPKSFYRFFATKDVDGMSQIMYETLKKVVNEDFTEHFKNCSSKTFIFWGLEDSATPLLSGEKIHSLVSSSYFYPLEGDHYFFLKKSKEIEAKLCEMIA